MVVSNTEQLSTDENGEQFRWVSEKYFLFCHSFRKLTVLPGFKRPLFCQKSTFTIGK